MQNIWVIFENMPLICKSDNVFTVEDWVFVLFFKATCLKSSVLANPANADNAKVDPLATTKIIKETISNSKNFTRWLWKYFWQTYTQLNTEH